MNHLKFIPYLSRNLLIQLLSLLDMLLAILSKTNGIHIFRILLEDFITKIDSIRILAQSSKGFGLTVQNLLVGRLMISLLIVYKSAYIQSKSCITILQTSAEVLLLQLNQCTVSIESSQCVLVLRSHLQLLTIANGHVKLVVGLLIHELSLGKCLLCFMLIFLDHLSYNSYEKSKTNHQNDRRR